MNTSQIAQWAGDWGKKYTDRSGQSPEEFDRTYLRDYDLTRSARKAVRIAKDFGFRKRMYLKRGGFTFYLRVSKCKIIPNGR